METTDAIYVPIILGVTEVFKMAGIDAKYAPVIAVALGVVIAYFTGGREWSGALTGIVWGLSASGLYSGTKSVIGK